MLSREALALVAGLMLSAIGVVQWVEDLRAIGAAVEVTGTFTGAQEVRNAFAPEFTAANTLHPLVEVTPPGGGRAVMVLEDDMEEGRFAAAAERAFLYVPGEPPTLRLPERLSRWGGPFVWWSVGIGLLMTAGASWEIGRIRRSA